ncbi:5'-nucleotidase, lipoprotein e(P4) family [Luteimonas pelagia]
MTPPATVCRRLAALPLLLLAACATTTPHGGDAPQPAADDNLNAVAWIQTAPEYAAVAEQTWRAATARLDPALADPTWDALVASDRDGGTFDGLPPAIVVDVDETVLDNSPYQARLVRTGAEYTSASWDAWVREARAVAVPGALAFARAAQSRGITMIYLSNRTEAQETATLANLRALGFPVAAGDVFLGKGTAVPGCVQPGDSDKRCRRRLVGGRYRVLLMLGDQLGDFVAEDAGDRDSRQALYAAHGARFGDRWWMLPNPSYGGWEPALFDEDWSLSREARRERKRDALRTGDRSP